MKGENPAGNYALSTRLLPFHRIEVPTQKYEYKYPSNNKSSSKLHGMYNVSDFNMNCNIGIIIILESTGR